MFNNNRRNSICINSVRNDKQFFDGSCIVKDCVIDGFYNCYFCNNLSCIKHTEILENIHICINCKNNNDLNNSINLLIINKNKKNFCDYFNCFKQNTKPIKPL